MAGARTGRPEPRDSRPADLPGPRPADPPRPLLRAEVARDSVEALLAEHGTGGSGIYVLLLLVVGAAVAALPLVKVPVTIRSPGVLRPALESHIVRAPADGVVLEVLARENQQVRSGELLARMAPMGAVERESELDLERRRAAELVGDLERLTGFHGDFDPDALRTGSYRLALKRHMEAMEQHASRVDHLQRETDRTTALVERDVLPRSALEEQSFRLEQERRAGAMSRQSTMIEWESDLLEGRARLTGIEAEQAALRAAWRRAELTAPVAGAVQQLAAISPGSRLRAGDQVALVSPDTSLVGVVHAADRLIGLVAPGTRVRLEFQAYPAAEWGVVRGRVVELAADAVPRDGGAVHPIWIELEEEHLTLRNGRRGMLRKGMAFRARFTLARRSLWALLHDDVSDWLSPSGPEG